MKILSFDVSSTTTGWALFNIDKKNKYKLLKSGIIKPPKDGDIFLRLALFRKQIQDIIEFSKPDSVAIENIVQFMARASSANTIITLALYNRMVGLTVFDMMNVSPHLYNVMSIRHGLKLSKELPKKEDMPALVESILGIKLPVKLTKNGKIKPELYDETDAIAVGLHHIKNHILKEQKK